MRSTRMMSSSGRRGPAQLRAKSRADHLQHDVLGNVPEADLVPADVDRQETCYIGELVLGGPFDEMVSQTGVGAKILGVGHRRSCPQK